MNILISELPESIAKEFTVNNSGQGFVSRRGIARLCGVKLNSVQALLKKIENSDQQTLPKTLKVYAGQGFNPDQQIPDILASAIIQYYAFNGKESAQDSIAAIGAIGLRTVIQKSLGWEAEFEFTQRQLVERLCLPVPTKWEPRFSVEFYSEMSRLTGLTPIGNKRPYLWAKLTKELVYDYLPKGVYQEIKSWQLATDPNKKLHQYLSEQGIEILGEHLKRVITLMQCATHISEVEFMLSQSMTKLYQYNLFHVKK